MNAIALNAHELHVCSTLPIMPMFEVGTTVALYSESYWYFVYDMQLV
jgi:hypothetical protein